MANLTKQRINTDQNDAIREENLEFTNLVLQFVHRHGFKFIFDELKRCTTLTNRSDAANESIQMSFETASKMKHIPVLTNNLSHTLKFPQDILLDAIFGG